MRLPRASVAPQEGGLRIPMRGYEMQDQRVRCNNQVVTNPHEGL